MLDHLSHGRSRVGVGRGVSPFELAITKSITIARATFSSTPSTASAPVWRRTLSSESDISPTRTCRCAAPVAEPYPPFWYGSSNEIGSTWAGEQGLHFVTLGPTTSAKTNVNAYKAALNKRGGRLRPRRNFQAAPRSACSGTSSSPTPMRRRIASASRRWHSSRAACQLAARHAWRDRAHLAAQCAARRHFERFVEDRP